ncbi:hypothetical protein INR49_031035 [Caranx melampygus]|nr:hypothetical protein INR49_031035 [Caranx melampygus]
MLINICFSLLAIPWWLEGSAAAAAAAVAAAAAAAGATFHIVSLYQLRLPQKQQTGAGIVKSMLPCFFPVTNMKLVKQLQNALSTVCLGFVDAQMQQAEFNQSPAMKKYEGEGRTQCPPSCSNSKTKQLCQDVVELLLRQCERNNVAAVK